MVNDKKIIQKTVNEMKNAGSTKKSGGFANKNDSDYPYLNFL